MLPFIRKAITDMAYDNGCINRYNEEKELVERVFNYIIETYSESMFGVLQNTEFFLMGLSEEDFEELICGELLPNTPAFVEEVLEDIFENL